MKSGSVHRGTVDHIEEVVFWLDEQGQTQPVRIAYHDVSKIKSRNSTDTSTATKKVVQHAIAAALIACAVILISAV
jgi:hypothetical protein